MKGELIMRETYEFLKGDGYFYGNNLKCKECEEGFTLYNDVDGDENDGLCIKIKEDVCPDGTEGTMHVSYI